MESPPPFSSVEDECRYWKRKAKSYYTDWADAKLDFDEFVEESKQLEAEMETTLEQKETVIRDLRKQVVQLEKENESLRIKLDSFGIEFSNLEKQLTSTQREKDKMKTYLRQLEQKNDDLERAHRILSESIAGFETMLDKAYEKNALLEMEVDEKEALQEKLQRLMDETRDLKQELNIKGRQTLSTTPSPTPTMNQVNGLIPDEDGLLEHSRTEVQTQTATGENSIGDISFHEASLKHSTQIFNGNGNAMPPSTKTTALNIVADMIRKLNLDKTLLCSRCDKFRCICERPVVQNSNLSCSTTRRTPSVNSLTSAVTGSSNLSLNSTTSTTNNNTMTMSTNSNSTSSNRPEAAKTTMTTTTSNFGSNFLKRLSQKVTGSISAENAMELKLKTYRDERNAAFQ